MKNSILLMVTLSSFFLMHINSWSQESNWPKRVLITNDDGINDPKTIALAKAFSKICDTHVVAPKEDKSGSTHYITVYSKHYLKVEKRNIADGIKAFAVDGFPGDCVLLALQGIMKHNPPDLVISGINGGSNLGFDWLASGTIGAARIASYWGVPAIAISGMKEEIEGSLDAAIDWIVELAQSDYVQAMKPKQYLTISIPKLPPAEIKGIKIAERAGILLDFSFRYSATDDTNQAIWSINPPQRITDISPTSDAALYYSGYIVLVPMFADENDNIVIEKQEKLISLIPEWKFKK